MTRPSQLIGALLHENTRVLHGRFDGVDGVSLLVHQRTELLVNLIHANDVVFELPNRSLLIFEGLQVDFLLHLKLRRSFAVDEVVLEARFGVAVAVGSLRLVGSGRLRDRRVRFRLPNCILLEVNCLSLDCLEGCEGGGELVDESVPLDLQVTVFAVHDIFQGCVSVFDELLRVRADLVELLSYFGSFLSRANLVHHPIHRRN